MPQSSWISGVAENDLSEARPLFDELFDSKVYSDKIYNDRSLNIHMQQKQNSVMRIPVKKKKAANSRCCC